MTIESTILTWFFIMCLIAIFFVILGVILSTLNDTAGELSTDSIESELTNISMESIRNRDATVIAAVVGLSVIMPIIMTWMSARFYTWMRFPDAYMIREPKSLQDGFEILTENMPHKFQTGIGQEQDIGR